MKNIGKQKENKYEFKQVNRQDKEMLTKVKKLFLEYAQSLEINLDFQDFETELNSLPGKYGLPYGVLILALVDDRVAGCIALRKIYKNICEMKRLYVCEDYRGLGIGKTLINMIIEEAKKLNYQYIRLDTLPTMKKAQDLYESIGFYDIDSYRYNPINGTRFMELNIEKYSG